MEAMEEQRPNEMGPPPEPGDNPPIDPDAPAAGQASPADLLADQIVARPRRRRPRNRPSCR